MKYITGSIFATTALGLTNELLFAVCPAVAENQAKWPTVNWEQTIPEAVGFDTGKLADALSKISREVQHVHVMLIDAFGLRLEYDDNNVLFYAKERTDEAGLTIKGQAAL